MKTSFYDQLKLFFLFTIVLFSFLPGFSSLALGQNRLTEGKFVSVKSASELKAAMVRQGKVLGPAQNTHKAVFKNPGANNQFTENQDYEPLATRTASVSGPWSSTTTWGGASVPTAGDEVRINSGITVTVDVAAVCQTLTYKSVATSSAITISGTNSLTVSGLITMPRPNTGTTCTLNVNAGNLSCGSISMAATTDARLDVLNITTGSATISGTISTNGSACQLNITAAGTLNIGGTFTGTPTLSTVPGSTVNYTGSGAQTIYPIGYQGNLGLSGTGTKTISDDYSSNIVFVDGTFTNSSTLVLTAGTSTSETYLVLCGNSTNNPGATIDATADYTNLYFYGTASQTFANNGTVSSPLFSLTLENAAGLTITGNQIITGRVNLFYGTLTNANKITLGTGGTSYATVQRGVADNTYPAGNFADPPIFNVGSAGLSLLYDDGIIAYNTGNEVPATLPTIYVYMFDAADVTLNCNLTISSELNFYGGTGTPAFRIGANTLILGGAVTYNTTSYFCGNPASNLIMNGITTLNTIDGCLNDFTINANTTLGGTVNVSGTLTLANGCLLNGSNLTMATGSTITRSGGSLSDSPTFAGTVNLLYTGSSPIITGKELPTGASVLNHLTTNTGGVTQNAAATTTLLTDAFPNLNNWTGNKGAGDGKFASSATAHSGGVSPEARFTGSITTPYPTSNTTFFIYRTVLNSTGYSALNVSFKTMSIGSYTQSVPSYLKLQTSTSIAGPWHDAWSVPYSELPAQTVTIPNYTTDVGGNIYFRFAFVGDFYCLDYWYFDDLNISGMSSIPVTATVNGKFDLKNGPYTIGAGNTLGINGSISGSGALNGGSTSNLVVGGSGANLVLPSITGGLNNLTINRPNGVSIASTRTLTVYGTLTNNAGISGLVLKSDGTGTASLIHNTNNVPATVERYLTPMAWHYISSPVGNATANVFLSDYLMTSDPAAPTGWTSWIVDPSSPLQVMRGYACWKPNTNPVLESFPGTLNTGNTSITLTRTPSDQWAGWHLVGNPYPSAINLSTGITWDHFEPVAYFWDENGSGNPLYASGNYNVALASPANFGTHSGFAPASQGFYVHINSTWTGSSTLTFTNAARVHNNESFLKDVPVISNALLMSVKSSANNYSDKISVHFNPDATSGYDPGYDAAKLWGLTDAPQLYTRIGETVVTCNSLPFENKNKLIQMGFSCGLSGTYTLTADSLSTFADTISVGLEDLKLHVIQNLKTNPVYSFTYNTSDDANRFILHFDKSALGLQEPGNEEAFQIYSYDNNICIKALNGNTLKGDVYVFDLLGKEVYQQALPDRQTNRITLNVEEGYYVVKVVTGKKVDTRKVFLNMKSRG